MKPITLKHKISKSDEDITDEEDNDTMPGLQNRGQDDSSSDNDMNIIEVTMTHALTQAEIIKNTYLMKAMTEEIDTHTTSPTQTVVQQLNDPTPTPTMTNMIVIMTKKKTRCRN